MVPICLCWGRPRKREEKAKGELPTIPFSGGKREYQPGLGRWLSQESACIPCQHAKPSVIPGALRETSSQWHMLVSPGRGRKGGARSQSPLASPSNLIGDLQASERPGLNGGRRPRKLSSGFTCTCIQMHTHMHLKRKKHYHF